MNRRDLLRAGAGLALAAGGLRAQEVPARGDGPRIETVRGPIAPDRLGLTLPHEHVLVDFIGADRTTPDRYDADEVFRVARPHLERVRALGGRALVECTPAYLGRDPALLRRLSEATGLHILTPTGFYAANGGKHLPPVARDGTSDDLARLWVAEARAGIGTTGIRPGFIKIGVDAGPLDAVARTLVGAAARAHHATGLTIASHTGNGQAASDQLQILHAAHVDPSAWIWVHAQNAREPEDHTRAARMGAWVEFDGLAPDTVEQHVALVENLRRAGLLGRALVSHDAGWYHVGEPGGGTFRPFDTLFTAFLPRLRERGWTEAEIRQLTIENPRAAFTIRRRVAPG